MIIHGSLNQSQAHSGNLPKCPTGVRGLDEITFGGIPRGRTTLVCGGAGCGKTLLGMEFLVRGAVDYGEPGVCISFEENVKELSSNVASLGFDVKDLISRKLLAIDYVFLERSLIDATGDYDLEGLFVRLGLAIDSVGAKRILLDTVESLFAGLPNEAILRSELRRLFRWIKERKLTAIVTGEGGREMLTRHGLQEYISDCVILLDHRVIDTVSTRRLRVVKYRGSTHGSNEYPFLIDTDGLSVLPLTSLGLQHAASQERVSTGIHELDEMFGGPGYFRASSILVSGTAGTGKTSLTASFVDAACRRGERCVFFSFEESAAQIVRNMASIGMDLNRWIDAGLLAIDAARPTTFGLETHLVRMHKLIQEFAPGVVVVDPVTALLGSGTELEARSMLLRLIDFLKANGITALLTTLTQGAGLLEETTVNISSLVDSWLLLRDIESGGERNRGLRSARVSREAHDASAALAEQQELERKQLAIERKRKALEGQIAMLQLDLDRENDELQQLGAQRQKRLDKLQGDMGAMADSRSGSNARSGGITEVPG